METLRVLDMVLIIISLLLLATVVYLLFWRINLRKKRSSYSWSEEELPGLTPDLVLDEPPHEYIFEIGDGEEEGDCSWSVKYATAVDSTDNATEWRFLKTAPSEENECARYEIIVASTLHSLENPAEDMTDRQVHYGGLFGFGGWWETVREYLSRRLSFGPAYEGFLALGMTDLGPRWGQEHTPPEHEASRDKKNGVPVRDEKESATSNMEFHETIYIKIKLEPGRKEECFPASFHEFWGTAASFASAELAWRCHHASHNMQPGSCGSSAPAENSSMDAVRARVGGVVKCTPITQLNYELVEENDTEVNRAWNADSLGGTITTDLSPQIGLSAGPLSLGTVSASIDPTSHNQSSRARDYVTKKPVRGSRTANELVMTLDTFYDANLELQTEKDDNYNSSVNVSVNNRVVHHTRIIGRTDEDAPCECCQPGIELRLGNGLVNGQPGASHAEIIVGGHTFSLRHPGWETASGWASPGDVRVWSLS